MSNVLIALIAGVAPTLAIIANYVLGTKQRTANDQKADVKLDGIHVLVNGRLSEALERITELEQALGIKPDAPVPPPA